MKVGNRAYPVKNDGLCVCAVSYKQPVPIVTVYDAVVDSTLAFSSIRMGHSRPRDITMARDRLLSPWPYGADVLTDETAAPIHRAPSQR